MSRRTDGRTSNQHHSSVITPDDVEGLVDAPRRQNRWEAVAFICHGLQGRVMPLFAQTEPACLTEGSS